MSPEPLASRFKSSARSFLAALCGGVLSVRDYFCVVSGIVRHLARRPTRWNRIFDIQSNRKYDFRKRLIWLKLLLELQLMRLCALASQSFRVHAFRWRQWSRVSRLEWRFKPWLSSTASLRRMSIMPCNMQLFALLKNGYGRRSSLTFSNR